MVVSAKMNFENDGRASARRPWNSDGVSGQGAARLYQGIRVLFSRVRRNRASAIASGVWFHYGEAQAIGGVAGVNATWRAS